MHRYKIRDNMFAITVLLLALGGAAAGACPGGDAPGANGCCAETQQCPSCCLSKQEGRHACTCHGCGGTPTYDARCTPTSCAAYLASAGDTLVSAVATPATLGGCSLCIGALTLCSTSESAFAACLAVSPATPPCGAGAADGADPGLGHLDDFGHLDDGDLGEADLGKLDLFGSLLGEALGSLLGNLTALGGESGGAPGGPGRCGAVCGPACLSSRDAAKAECAACAACHDSDGGSSGSSDDGDDDGAELYWIGACLSGSPAQDSTRVTAE